MTCAETEGRTEDEIRDHYRIEKELAGRLRSASKRERASLYSSVYEEMFRRVPHHPMLTRKVSGEMQAQAIAQQMILLNVLIRPNIAFLEIGPGDCALSFAVARHVKMVFAVDVSETITAASSKPINFVLTISDGCSIPLPAESVDLAYSNQLMEHLHPDDALEQLKNIHRVLKPGGRYLCITPNRLNGPHDVSRGFDAEATGFHLKEYTVTELEELFRRTGFAKVHIFVGSMGHYLRLPIFLSSLCEKLLIQLPNTLRQKVAGVVGIRHLIDIKLLAMK